MREKKAKKVLQQVKETYNSIAGEFSDTRKFSWAEFDFFVPYLKHGMEIVDLGCGNGRLVNFLNEKTLGWDQPAFHYLGIDNSEKLLEKAQQLYPNYVFVSGDQLQIPVAEEKVDLLFNIAAFHHIPTRKLQLQALSEMKRVLKKDGILIMTVWNLWQKKYCWPMVKAFLKMIFSLGYHAFNDFYIPWGSQKIPRYYHAFLIGELQNLFKEAGFEIVELFCARQGKKVHLRESTNICLIAKKCST